MKPFTYERAKSPAEAVRAVTSMPGSRFIAGGTNLLDLMKFQIDAPTHLVDVRGLPFTKIEETKEGGLLIGALVTNTDLASHPRVKWYRIRFRDSGWSSAIPMRSVTVWSSCSQLAAWAPFAAARANAESCPTASE